MREPLIRLLLINVGIGAAAAVVFVAGLLVLDPFLLRTLIFADASPYTVTLLLLAGFIVTLGSVAMGAAIMSMPDSGRE